MALQNTNPTTTVAWKKLQEHYNFMKDAQVKELFKNDASRAEKFTIKEGAYYYDYSKNRITEETMSLLLELANEMNLAEGVKKYFAGDHINQTEDRAVLHTALRADRSAEIWVDGENVVNEVYEVREKIKGFSEKVISGALTGYSGKPFTDVVNIGIGGSDLGPAMVVEALQYYKNHLTVHFVSNVDGDHVHETIAKLNPETTLFVIVSKTFTTQETLSNATTIKNWFLKHGNAEDVAKHFVAVSTNLEHVSAFGIASENVFPMWDWVGGRFSLWSAVGLSISLAVGYEGFDAMLEGAKKMDEHFKTTPFERNVPVLLGLLTVWYNNFFGAQSEAIIPYTQYLSRFSAYLQQGIMESNGKGVDRAGNPVDYQTGTIIWGEPGTNSQHAFFQLIHQGTKIIPTDFIGYIKPLHGDKDHHGKLMANFFAQTEALLNGKTAEEVVAEFEAKGVSAEEYTSLVNFKVFTGNRPTTTILGEKLSPESLGNLIALYEHRIFVQGFIWNIFSYDQWGVELGKQLASGILKDIYSDKISEHDNSTVNLLKIFKANF